jgi:hypothetical protein
VRYIKPIYRIRAARGANDITMVVLFVGCVVLAEREKTYYSYIDILRSNSFWFPPEPK